MKKTLVAAAVAAVVAAPAVSFADVKIGGNVIQEFVTDGDQTGVSEDGLESKAAVDLVFSVSEDLGNGMSTFAKIHTLRDNGGSGNADQVVGLKGDFGTIMMGRMEDFSEGKVAGMASVDSSDALSIEPNGAYDTGRNEGGIAYVSPSFNGLTFGVAGYALSNGGVASSTSSLSLTASTLNVGGTNLGALSQPAGTPSSLSATASTLNFSSAANNKDADAKIDATDIMIEYANGPLLVRAAIEDLDGKVYNTANAKDQKTKSIAASYKMDNVTLVGYMFDVDNGQGVSTNDTDGYMVGAKIGMGANTFGLGYSEETNVNCSGSTCTKQTNGDNEAWIVSVDHALSKRTSLTAAYKSFDDKDAGVGKDQDNFAVGLKHVF